jgi:hypothetical protein
MIIDSPWDYSLDHDLPESSVTGDRNHLRIRARIPESPVRPRPDQRSAPGVGLRRRKSCPFGRRRPTTGRRPPRRLKSAFQGACAPGVGLRRRKRPPPGRRRPTIGRRPPQAEFIRHTWPKASTPIEIGLPRRSTPGVGLRQRKRHPPGRRRPTAGRRPPRRLKSAFQGACAPSVSLRRRKRHLSVGAGRPSAEGLPRPNSFGTLRARRRPSPTQKAPSRSAQADRWPKAPGGRIHSARRPTTGRRPSQAEFIRHTWPTVGHRPPQGEFLRRASPARRRAGRPWRGV